MPLMARGIGARTAEKEGEGEGGEGEVVRGGGYVEGKALGFGLALALALALAWLGLGLCFGYLLACSPHPLHHMRLSTHLQLSRYRRRDKIPLRVVV